MQDNVELVFCGNSQWPLVVNYSRRKASSKPAITCSKLTIEILEQGAKYVQS